MGQCSNGRVCMTDEHSLRVEWRIKGREGSEREREKETEKER